MLIHIFFKDWLHLVLSVATSFASLFPRMESFILLGSDWEPSQNVALGISDLGCNSAFYLKLG